MKSFPTYRVPLAYPGRDSARCPWSQMAAADEAVAHDRDAAQAERHASIASVDEARGARLEAERELKRAKTEKGVGADEGW